MKKLILLYITCKNKKEAEVIGHHLIEKRLVACTNIYENMTSECLWPPKSGKYECANETVLLAKTIESNWKKVESEIKKTHSYQNPCIIAMPLCHVSQEYYDWLLGEIS